MTHHHQATYYQTALGASRRSSLIILFCLFLFAGCQPEQSELEIAKNLVLKIDKNNIQEAKPLLGGRSKANLFLIKTVAGKQYVVRFFSHESIERRAHIIKCQKIASQQGYGPPLYYTSIDQGVIVMKYLSPDKDATSKHRTPGELGNLLKTIHRGPSFGQSWSFWDRIVENIQKIDKALPKDMTGSKIRMVIKRIHQRLPLSLQSVPCHRDLIPANIIHHDHQLWAIDYDNAAQDDPFLDLALTGLSHQYTSKENQLLLSTYLSHSPTPPEIQQFDLYQDLGILFYATEMLSKLPPEHQKNSPSPIIDFPVLLEHLRTGQFNLDSPEHTHHLALSGIDYVLKKYE